MELFNPLFSESSIPTASSNKAMHDNTFGAIFHTLTRLIILNVNFKNLYFDIYKPSTGNQVEISCEWYGVTKLFPSCHYFLPVV